MFQSPTNRCLIATTHPSPADGQFNRCGPQAHSFVLHVHAGPESNTVEIEANTLR
ncbi:unnamed protein product, partial [Ceratitis capitata]